ncbi:hypothetical protein [Runella slithyformis]|uniref:Phosphatase PAP2 family protein n=1 Tax=Runella slithyformis (strain ATCC 29530 / DSM 19594 / LMG 11500 / NCIMB 11436 / LSU 4) TaxID=761193 RepID=A0A7U4E8V8_RUNSL|nr:hypothetical protein [Runella slithyformis]AEI51879.1 hypothetical protein Runsl_5589 [Runella slithyformis DSM 19594]
MDTRIALAVSALFHPLLMPTLLLGLLFFTAPDVLGVDVLTSTIRITLLGFVSMTTFVLPALGIYYLYRAGYVKSLHLDELADRRLPYFITTLIYIFATYFFSFSLPPLSEIAPEIGIILGSITVSIALVALISLYWKISAHSVGIGGMLGAVLGIVVKFNHTNLFYSLLALILLAGFLISARLKLNAHTPAQAVAGLLMGFCISLLTVWRFV